MTVKKRPAIRFKSFSESWHEKNMQEIGTFNPKQDIPEVFNYVDLESVVGNNLISFRHEQKISAPSRAQRLAQKGDLFYQAVRPYQRNNYLFEKTDGNFVFSTGYIQIRPSIDSYFLLSIVQQEKFVQDVLLRCTGTSYPAINISGLFDIKLSIPKEKEQSIIGAFFRQLDGLIVVAERKRRKTEQFKQAMLGKLFPKAGSTQPETRLKGFSGDWVEKPLGDIANINRGLTYSPADIRKSGVRVLRSSNIDENVYIEKSDDVFVDAKCINIPLIQNHDILITAANGSNRLVGKHAIIELGNTPTVHGGFMLSARTPNPFFLNASMSSDWYYKFINTFVAGGNGAIGNLSKNDLSKQVILIPKESEQTAIGNFFRQLDDTLTLQTRQIAALKRVKTALLAKMFV